MLSAVAESLTTTPLTRESPVPPYVSIPHCKFADRLADLDTDRSIGMRDDALERRRLHRPRVDVEATRP
jgi:hypothetical protein